MLAFIRQHLGMPLLAKELTEQAARSRTYVIRSLYAALLFAAGLFIVYGRGSSGGVAQMGQGQEMFNQIFRLQLLAIFVVLPATCAGAFAGEKERESLSLLLLTTIPRAMIVLQKLLSRVIPMLSFVVLSFPLLATAYSFGGVQTDQLYQSLVLLVLLAVFVGSISIMCSTYCRTTLEAFVATYLCLLGFVIAFWIQVQPGQLMYRLMGRFIPSGGLFESLFILIVRILGVGPEPVTLISYSLLAFTLACLFLYQRAFVPPKNLLLTAFRKVDAVFNDMNSVTGGVVLVKDGDPYPDSDPIAWRETAKRSLGTFRYLFRILVLIELPILLVSQGIRVDLVRSESSMSVLLYCLWVIAIVLTAIHSASVISTERSRQTLDVLLVSPIDGREILSRKLSGVRRLFWTLMVPFTTVFLFQHWFHGARIDLRYLILCFGGVFTVLPLVMWSGMAIGLVARSQMRAILILLGILAVVILSGPLLIYVLDLMGVNSLTMERLSRITPGSAVQFLESRFFARGESDVMWIRFWGLAAVISLYGIAAVLLRRWVLASADRLLGRVQEGGTLVGGRGDDEPVIEMKPAVG
ncbi:MAG: ABC transporter permease subunit [Planctomycetaceae bacterium]